MVWAGRDLKRHLVPTPCHRQGYPPLGQVVQSLIQPGIEQSWIQIVYKQYL